MRVLIVDDEPLSRNALKNAVGERKDVESLDSARMVKKLVPVAPEQELIA